MLTKAVKHTSASTVDMFGDEGKRVNNGEAPLACIRQAKPPLMLLQRPGEKLQKATGEGARNVCTEANKLCVVKGFVI
jgi:hypothetical protein